MQFIQALKYNCTHAYGYYIGQHVILNESKI